MHKAVSYTHLGRPVRTRAELEACRAGGRAEKGGGLAPAEYRRPAGEPPEVKAARQALAYAQETEIHRNCLLYTSRCV